MYVYEVGKPLQAGITKYEECVKFGFNQQGADMVIFFHSPTAIEVESIRTGKIELGFCEKDGIIFFLSKFAELNWMDAPYTVHLSQPFEFMEISENIGFAFTIILVDASTGLVKVIRHIGMSHRLSVELKAASLRQKQMPFKKKLYDQKVKQIYKNYTTNDLIKRATITCKQ